MKFYILPFFWFLLLGHTPLVVGPFLELSECNTIRSELPDQTKVTNCWTDSDAPLRRDHQ